MNHSFTECTEAITHDSDPKFLTFERLSTNPEFQASEGHVVSVIGQELALNTIETGDSPFEAGPTIGEITGGENNVVSLSVEPPVTTGNLVTTVSQHAVTFSQLTGGQIDFQIGYNDNTSTLVSVTGSQLASLAVAQGLGGYSDAYIDLGSVLPAGQWVTGPISAYVINSFISSNGLNISMSLSNGLKIQDGIGSQKELLNPINDTVALTAGQSVAVPAVTGYYTIPSSRLVAQFHLIGSSSSAGTIQVTFDLDDASSAGPFPITTDALKAIATSSGTLGDTHITVNSSELGWNLSALANRTVVSIDYSITVAFAANGSYSMGNGSSITIESDMFSPITSPGTVSHSVSMSGWGSNTPDFQIYGDWRSDSDSFEQLDINLAATDILAGATIAQLPLQNADIELVNTSISSFIATHVGWTIGGLDGASMASNYGPATIEEPSLFILSIVIPNDDGEVRHQITPIDPLDVVGSFNPGIERTLITPSTRVELRMILFPEDEPAVYGSNVVTHPYEIRQRNLPLFKFRLYDGRINPESVLTFTVMMFGSQGTPGVDENLLREWCVVPMDVLTNTGLSLGNASKAIDVDQHYPGLPDNFGGAAVYPAKEVVNPWNYIRFVIKPTQGKVNADYNNCYLTITANAREVL